MTQVAVTPNQHPYGRRPTAALLIACLVGSSILSACISVGGTKQDPSSPTANQKPVGGPTPPPDPAPRPTPVAEQPPAPRCNDKPRAERRALDAVSHLERGDSTKAELAVAEALECDPGNELAKRLHSQLRDDPNEWARKLSNGAVLACTIRPGESLSKVSETYLGDKYSFWMLARYNRIAVPSQVAAGQSVRIPTSRKQCAAPTPTISKPPAPDTSAIPPPPPPPPPPADDEVKRKIDALTRKAREARTQQKPAIEYASWTEILKLDPENRTAQVELPGARQRLCNYDPKQCP